jgi:MFS family permease
VRSIVANILSILLGVGTMLLGLGALNTLVGVRGVAEGFAEWVIGAVSAAYFIGYIGGILIWPRIIRRVGHIRAFAAFAGLASVAASLHGLAVDPWAWLVLRPVTGACVVGLYMVVESWLNALAPSAQRGRVFASYMAVSLLALAGGQYVLLAGDPRDYLLFGVGAMFFALALVPVALTRISAPEVIEAPRLGLRRLYGISPLSMVGSGAAGLTGGALWSMGPVFVTGLGLEKLAVAVFMSLAVMGGMLLQWPIGHLSDRIDRRRVLAGVCFGGFVLALAMLLVSGRYPEAGSYAPLLNLAAFFYGGFAFTVYSLSVAQLNDHLDPAEMMEGTGSLLLLYGVGAILGPLLAGGVMHLAGAPGLPAFLALVLLGSGLYGAHRSRVGRPIRPEDQVEFMPMLRTSQESIEMDPRTDVEPELDLQPHGAGGPAPVQGLAEGDPPRS